MTRRILIAIALIPAALLTGQYGSSPHTWWNANTGEILPWDEDYADPTGQVGIRNTVGAIHSDGHAFFEALGTNGRACITCHQPSNAMGLSAAIVRQRWTDTNGQDPLFAAIDGSNCPNLPQNDKASHSLLLDRGLIRIALPLPKSAEFEIEVVGDPTGCNTSPVYGLASPDHIVSVYRRPRITANFNFVAAPRQPFALMADGRELSLRTQAISAALTHEQAAGAPSDDKLRQIIDFESQIYAAQSSDARGGWLYEEHGPFMLGPDSLEHSRPARLDQDSEAWRSFETWTSPIHRAGADVQADFRSSAARGSALFSSRRFGNSQTCASCHSRTAPRWNDIGTTNRAPAEASAVLPIFKITCAAGPRQGIVIYSQDPGRALITGKCEDVGAIVIQQLRGLSARAPYFANGSAETLRDVVNYYDRHFHIGFSERDEADLTNFLSVL